MRMLVALLNRVIGPRIVLIAIDVAAHRILLVINLSAFLLRQVAAVGGAVATNFAVDSGFLVLKVAGLAGCQLTRADALADTRLLVGFTRVHPAHRRRRGAPVIFRREVCAVQARGVFVRSLQRCRLNVRFAAGCDFLSVRTRAQSTGAAVETGAVHGRVVHDDGAVDVGVVDDSFVHVNDSGVVCEHAAAPFSADEADAAVAEAVVNATIEADVRSPIAGVPCINAAAPTPVTRSPEQPDAGWCNPHSRHPVVASGAVRPIAGRPKVAGDRARRLFINWNRRRRYPDRNSNCDLRFGWRRCERNESHEAGKQQGPKRKKTAHKRVLPKGPLRPASSDLGRQRTEFFVLPASDSVFPALAR